MCVYLTAVDNVLARRHGRGTGALSRPTVYSHAIARRRVPAYVPTTF